MTEANSAKRVTIIGTGLIGGSLGLALKAAGLKGLEIAGYDQDWGATNRAEKMRAIDRAERHLERAVAGAGMVIIATPVLVVREVMRQIAGHLTEGAVVTDTASTKAHVMRWAAETLPPDVSFVGGHPMAGKETPGVENADVGLFRDKAYCLCPAVDASEPAVRTAVGLARAVGAEPLFIDAEEHDVYAAAVSHLPLMMSTALFSMLRTSPAWSDMGAMASSGFREMTRLTSGDPAMSHGIWATNREAVSHWLERMAAELQRYRDMLQDAQDEALLETFAKAQIERDIFIQRPPQRERPQEKVDTSQSLLQLLVGGMMARQIKRARELPELMKEAPPAAEGSGAKRRPSLAEKIAEDVRRDLERLEEKRARKTERAEKDSDSEEQ